MLGIFPLQLCMVVGLTGVRVQVAAFKVGNVTILIQRMVDYLALVKLNEPAQQKLLKCWAAGATHVSSNCKCSCRYSSVLVCSIEDQVFYLLGNLENCHKPITLYFWHVLLGKSQSGVRKLNCKHEVC